jgi:GntR family galactonate operon transcriptional repressor
MQARSLKSQRVADLLGRAIVSGEVPVGSALPSEAALCERYGVSRIAVREALKLLGSKHLITARPRVGGLVSPRSAWSLLDADVLRWMRGGPADLMLLKELARLRLAIEPEAAASAALRRDPAALAALEAALSEMAAHPGDALAADVAFHIALLAGSGNRFFAALGAMVESALSMSIPVTNAAKRVPKADVAAHRAVLTAISAGDPDSARERARALISETVRLLDTVAMDKERR